MSFLSVRGITLRYGGVAALDDVSLELERGQRLAVVGASGSGKSSLLRVLAGFEAPDAGQVHLDGQVLTDGSRMVPAHRRGIGVVAQEGALFPHLSVADNIGFGVPRRQANRSAWIARLADMVGLDAGMLDRGPDALSGGQQQRVALARALACEPRMILLDEPFSALDAALREDTRKAVAKLLARNGITSVLVTHDQEEALSFADRVAVLQSGRLLQAGTPQELYLRPRSEAVARLLGPAIILPALLSHEGAECALGTLPAGPATPGHASIMLRHEQIEIDPAGASGGAEATVQEVSFAGQFCTVSLRLHDGEVVTVRSRLNSGLAAGATVSLRVLGQVHVLDRGCTVS